MLSGSGDAAVVCLHPVSCRTLGLTTDELLGTREDGMSSGAGLGLEPTAVDHSVSPVT